MSAQPKSTEATPPRHVAIIMDGNGRWAKARMLPRVAGHRRGAEAVRATVRACVDLGVSYLTLYAFSSENWKRPRDEVDDLMSLLRIYLRQELAELHANGVCVRFIGDREKLSSDINRLIVEAETTTQDNDRLVLLIALNYGARSEIVGAARDLARQAAAGEVDPAAIDEEAFAARLETKGVPDPDVIIRTSGEKRLSNFLLWQSAYAELIFVDSYWPDFDKGALEDALSEFHARERRYGARP